MNLARCANGHFYDKEKYASCPHCANGTGADDGRTYAFGQAETESMKPEFSQPFTPSEQAPQMINPFPISGMGAGDQTMPVTSDYEDTPTVPIQQNPFEDTPTGNFVNQTITTPVEDIDHTVGFFDTDFFTDNGKSYSTPVEMPKQVKKAPKLNSPCVGWLIAIGGKSIGTDFRLKVGKNYVGRSASNDIVLAEDKSVSREKHAIVVYEPKNHMYFVQPGESSSLVYINDDLVLTPVLLKAYDIITVGEVNLLFMPLCSATFNWTAVLDELKAASK